MIKPTRKRRRKIHEESSSPRGHEEVFKKSVVGSKVRKTQRLKREPKGESW